MPADPTVIRVNIGDVLQAIEDKLLAAALVGSSAAVIWWISDDDPPNLASQKDVVLWPRSCLSIEGTNEGGSRWDFRVSQVIDIILRTSKLGGPGATDKAWIKSHAAVAIQLLDALQGFYPTDTDNNALLIELMRLTTGSDPRRKRERGAYGRSVTSWKVLYYPGITPSDLTESPATP